MATAEDASVPDQGPEPEVVPWHAGPEARALLDGAPLPILVRDQDGRYLYANDEALDILARPRGDVGFDVYEVFPEALATHLRDLDRQVASDGETTVVESDLPMPGRGLRTFLLAKFPVRPTPDGEALVATIATDVTEQKQLERDLAESDLRLRQLTDNLEDAVVLTRVDTMEVLYVSPRMANLFSGGEWNPDDENPWSFLDRVHPEDRDRMAETIQRVNREGTSAEIVYRVVHPGGRIRYLRSRANAVRGPDGEMRVATIVSDVTADHEMEDRLRHARRVAEEANARKDEFLSQMSHELRTPLNAILGFSQLLELDADALEPDQVDSVRQIRRAGQHLLDLINEVLDMTRVERGVVRLSLEAVDVGEVVSETCQLLEPQAKGRSVSVHATPVSDGPVLAIADRQRLTQILINLVANAIKYNRSGGRVDVTWHQTANHGIHIDVADTGSGISALDIDRVFTPFERLGRPESTEGTGIGLAISRRLVDAMGGRIDVESRVGFGTTFTVELPAAPASRNP